MKVDPDAPPVDLPSLRALLARLAVEAWRRDRATARGPDDVENEDDEEDERQDVAPAA